MGEVTYANMLTEAQANVWNALKADSTVLTYTSKILDGVPLGLTQGTGFPYVIVPTPTVDSEDYMSFSKKKEQILFRIEVFDRKESVLRTLCDAVRNCLEGAKNTFKNTYGMYRFLNAKTDMSYIQVEDNSVVYNYTMHVTYEWVPW